MKPFTYSTTPSTRSQALTELDLLKRSVDNVLEALKLRTDDFPGLDLLENCIKGSFIHLADYIEHAPSSK